MIYTRLTMKLPLLAALCSLTLLAVTVCAQDKELRGVWMTPRTPSGLWSKEEIGQAIAAAAHARCNTIYFNAWSRGWPLWHSKRFARETGHATDPHAGARDVLAEAITAAHRSGVELVAWMEYGFVGWWTGQEQKGAPKGPLFAKHPEWLARDAQGLDLFSNGQIGSVHWMAHHREDVQEFLVELHAEVARGYDVDGIELERIRYPQLDCGYDAFTVDAWKKGHDGQPPPKDGADAAWMRFRADALVRFQRDAHRAIKAANPRVQVTSASSHSGTGKSYSAYETTLQDWRAWLKEGSVDAIELQMFATAAELKKLLPSALEGIEGAQKARVRAGIAMKTATVEFQPDELVGLIETVREAGLTGHVLWSWNDLRAEKTLDALRTKAYVREAIPPHREQRWRVPAIVLDERQQRHAATWREIAWPQADGGTCLGSGPSGSASIEYRAEIVEPGSYDVLAFESPAAEKLSTKALWTLHADKAEKTQVFVDQSLIKGAGWRKLGTITLAKGERQVVAVLSNQDPASDRVAIADTVMLVIDRGTAPAKDASTRK